MRSVAVSLIMLVLVAAASGCVVKSGDSKAKTTEGSSAAPSGSGSAANESANVTAPGAQIVVLDNGTAITAVNGSLPAKAGVNLTFDGSGSTGSNLTYAWAFGDNGTADNATTVHAFATSGNYSVTLTVKDASNGTATASVNLTILPSGPAPGTALRTDKKTYTVTWTCAASTSCGTTEGTDQKTWIYDFPGLEASGVKSMIKHVLITSSGGTTNVDSDVHFFDPKGKELGSGTSSGPAEKIELNDQTLGAGAYKVQGRGCLGANASFTINVQFDIVAA